MKNTPLYADLFKSYAIKKKKKVLSINPMEMKFLSAHYFCAGRRLYFK